MRDPGNPHLERAWQGAGEVNPAPTPRPFLPRPGGSPTASLQLHPHTGCFARLALGHPSVRPRGELGAVLPLAAAPPRMPIGTDAGNRRRHPRTRGEPSGQEDEEQRPSVLPTAVPGGTPPRAAPFSPDCRAVSLIGSAVHPTSSDHGRRHTLARVAMVASPGKTGSEPRAGRRAGLPPLPHEPAQAGPPCEHVASRPKIAASFQATWPEAKGHRFWYGFWIKRRSAIIQVKRKIAMLAGQPIANLRGLAQEFLSYYPVLPSRCPSITEPCFQAPFPQEGKTNLSRDGLNPAHVPF